MPLRIQAPSAVKRATEALGWVGSSALLLALPKCPACLAAYALVWTGVGISFTAASYVRIGVTALCVAALCGLAFYRIKKVCAHRRPTAAGRCEH